MRFSSSIYHRERDGNDQINVLSAEQELRLVNIWDNVTRELNQQGFCEELIFSCYFSSAHNSEKGYREFIARGWMRQWDYHFRIHLISVSKYEKQKYNKPHSYMGFFGKHGTFSVHLIPGGITHFEHCNLQAFKQLTRKALFTCTVNDCLCQWHFRSFNVF